MCSGFGEHDMQGDYYPGHLKGDSVHLLVSPRQLRAEPRKSSRIPANSFRRSSNARFSTPDGVRLEFAGGLQVEVPREAYNQTKDWMIEFPTRRDCAFYEDFRGVYRARGAGARHLCAGQILGVRMAICGLQHLGIEDPTAPIASAW